MGRIYWRVGLMAVVLVASGVLTGCRGKDGNREAQLQALQADNDALRRENEEFRRRGTATPTGDFGFPATAIAGGVRIDISGDVLFAAGEAKLKDSVKPKLLAAAKVLKQQYSGYHIRVDGHSDSDQPKRVKHIYPTNWDLSAARAVSVLRFLTDEGGLNQRDCSIGGWAEFNPVASNATSAGKAKNRRVEIFVLSPGVVSRGAGSESYEVPEPTLRETPVEPVTGPTYK